MEQGKENLLDFQWEENDSLFDFSDGADDAQIEVGEVKESPKEDKDLKDPEESVESEDISTDNSTPDSTNEEDFFGETSEEKVSKESGEDLKTEPSIYADLVKDLKEKGIFKHVELEEGENIDVDKLYELQEEEYEKEVDERINTWASKDLDEDAKEFIKFKRNGGNTEDFFKTYQSSSELPIGDIEDETHQDRVIRYKLKKEGWEEDDIEDNLAYLTDNGKKGRIAKKYYEDVELEDKTNKKEILRQAEESKKEGLNKEVEFKSNIKNILETTNDVKGIKVSDKEKADLFNFLTKKTYKTESNRTLTGFQKKLGDVFQDPNKMVLLAKLVNNDFDMSDFEKKVITNKTKQIKTNLEQRKNTKTNTFGSSVRGKSVADYF